MVSERTTRLECSALCVDYGAGPRALDGVSLAIGAGELLAVLGPNGSGKSTLLRCLAGLLRATSGAVSVDGQALTALGPRERAMRIAYVPQYLPAVPDVRVDDFVLGGRYAHIERWRGPRAEDWRAVEQALEVCDVAELRERSLAAISGGQRQRVLIARAAAQSAPIVVVDEPTASLDPAHQVSVFRLLADLSRAGRAVVVATHELGLASRVSTSMLVLLAGRVRARGAPLDVLTPAILREVYGPDLHVEVRDGGVIVAPWVRG